MLQTAAEGGVAAAPGLWGPEDGRESVDLFLKKGALPAVYIETVRTGLHLGCKVGMQTEALLLTHLRPDH
eukprot:7684312-Lingulodinium_polyedra.AAC.1